MSGRDGSTIQLLTGEAMWPDRINARWPGAQFIARARFDAGNAIRPQEFETLDSPAVWGILVQLPGVAATGRPTIATTDRGEAIEARFDAVELLAGDSESVVSAARYWELPWRYVGALRDAVAMRGIEIIDEEPRDDANIDSPASD